MKPPFETKAPQAGHETPIAASRRPAASAATRWSFQ